MQNAFQNSRSTLHTRSDHEAELIAQLEPEQCAELLSQLKAMTYCEWLNWLRSHTDAVLQYDALTTKKRAVRLKARPAPPEISPLRLQHACAWLCAVHRCAGPVLPPDGAPLFDQHSQRHAFLNVWAAFEEHGIHHLWPFDHPPDVAASGWPFAD